MLPDKSNSLPFLTRKMLDFEHATTFGLRITTQSDRTNPITIRGLTKDQIFAFKHIPTVLEVGTTEDFRIPDMPIAISVVDDTNAYREGEIYVSLFLTLNGEIIHQLCAGSIYRRTAITYPETQAGSQRRDGGMFTRATSTEPGADENAIIHVPSNRNYRVIGGTVQLVTDATAANRRMHLIYLENAIEVMNAISDVDQVASTTKRYTFAPFGHLPTTSHDNDILVPIPSDWYLRKGAQIATAVTNLQFGDDLQIMSFMVEAFFTTI